MKDEFQVGDVVVCVNAKPARNPIVPIAQLLREGAMYRIAGLPVGNNGEVGLCLDGVAIPVPMVGFAYDRFRKLPRAEEDFTLRIRACRPPLRLSAPSGER